MSSLSENTKTDPTCIFLMPLQTIQTGSVSLKAKLPQNSWICWGKQKFSSHSLININNYISHYISSNQNMKTETLRCSLPV